EQALNGAFPTLNWQAPPSTYLAWIDLRPLGIDDQKLQHTLIHEEQFLAVLNIVLVLASESLSLLRNALKSAKFDCPKEAKMDF
ncbi:hypothetical protein MJN54_35415, partial [Salmonella enterica subsp. enterica serovar Kentucky]|nr:hypothetical protein [Salmonella enterica subsp. enterica serovar Kentucky]